MKKSVIASFFIFLLAFPVLSFPATHYVRAGATGTSSGADWDNAFPSLPQALVRGDTYYIADGEYPGYVFDDAQAGADFILIKKAISTDHGADGGWQAAFGDGQAVFKAPLTFKTGYYDIDGQTGGGPGNWDKGFGIKAVHAPQTNGSKIIKIENASFLSFRHMELAFDPCPACNGQDVIYAAGGGGNWLFQDTYMHHPSRVIFFTQGASDIIIDRSLLERSGVNPSSSQHSEVWAARDTHNVIFKNSLVRDFVSTGGIIMGRASNWKIFGNIFQWTKDWGPTANNGAIGSWSSDPTYYARDISIYNNTFAGFTNGGSARIFPIFASIANITVNNNIWVNSPGVAFGTGVTHDYNLFCSPSGSSISEPNKEERPDNIFVNAPEDFRLTSATAPGLALPQPFDIDMDGVTRGADGTWDKGAFEFNAGRPTVTPSAPANLRITD